MPIEGRLGAIDYDESSGRFRLEVFAGDSATARIQMFIPTPADPDPVTRDQ